MWATCGGGISGVLDGKGFAVGLFLDWIGLDGTGRDWNTASVPEWEPLRKSFFLPLLFFALLGLFVFLVLCTHVHACIHATLRNE